MHRKQILLTQVVDIHDIRRTSLHIPRQPHSKALFDLQAQVSSLMAWRQLFRLHKAQTPFPCQPTLQNVPAILLIAIVLANMDPLATAWTPSISHKMSKVTNTLVLGWQKDNIYVWQTGLVHVPRQVPEPGRAGRCQHSNFNDILLQLVSPD